MIPEPRDINYARIDHLMLAIFSQERESKIEPRGTAN